MPTWASNDWDAQPSSNSSRTPRNDRIDLSSSPSHPHQDSHVGIAEMPHKPVPDVRRACTTRQSIAGCNPGDPSAAAVKLLRRSLAGQDSYPSSDKDGGMNIGILTYLKRRLDNVERFLARALSDRGTVFKRQQRMSRRERALKRKRIGDEDESKEASRDNQQPPITQNALNTNASPFLIEGNRVRV
ncbi:MAG: hypothetical protein Q9193_000159 [Seirophora villosa]